MDFNTPDTQRFELSPELVEANFAARAKKATIGEKRKHASHNKRFFGCSEEWFNAIFPVVGGKNELAVAIYLYHLRALNRGHPFSLSNEKMAARLGVSRYTKYRTVAKLEAAGLLSVRRNGKSSPVITLKVV
jgi:replication initiation and membrane attachment protein DnaB